MIEFSEGERALLVRVLEMSIDVGRRSNPRLRPLSMYSSELKNLKQVADALERAETSGSSATGARTAARYRNTLRNLGLWDDTERFALNDGSRRLLELHRSGDGSQEFWREHSRDGDRICFDHQVSRIQSGEATLVSDAWREVFFNVQELADHVDASILQETLRETDLKQAEAIQYMDAVGTEPWRYARLAPGDRATVQDLMLRIRSDWDETQSTPTNPVDSAAMQYGKAISYFQRDMRFRVAGFIEAFMASRESLGGEFPRIAPDRTFIRSELTGRSPSQGRSAQERPTAGRDPAPLPLPRQVIISGCPGSGKSHFAEEALGSDAVVIRTQFHSDTSAASFIGGYRPVPVYEALEGLEDAAGAPAGRGRPYIDYRFVPGPAMVALSAALHQSELNIVLLIEELNRGNAAAAFGEFFQLLDREPDGWSRYEVRLSSEAESWLVSEGVLQSGSAVRLPPNLYIWATMNSGDQGVFPIDTAFRRRWAHRYLGYAQQCAYPPEERRVRFRGRDVDWDVFRAGINRKLKQLGVYEDRLLGPYFLTKDQLADPAEVLSKVLLYLWDDVLRFRQHELFRHDSFAAVSDAWDQGNGNPFIDGVVDLSDDVPQTVETLAEEGEEQSLPAEADESA